MLLDFCSQSSPADTVPVVVQRQNVVAFVDAKTKEVRRGAVERVAKFGIFLAASPLKRSL